MSIDFTKLSAHFPPSAIEWRVGSTKADKSKGMALAYLTARDVMDRLDDVCGPANWQDRYEFHGPRTVCYLSIRVEDQWVTKADGAGDSDVEAEKGAISDALKRCAVKWGIGRYLYDLESPWVEIEPAGKSFRIKRDEHAKLDQLLTRKAGAASSNVTSIPQSAPKPADPPAGSYRTKGGFERVEGPRLSAEDAATIAVVLDNAMRMAGSEDALATWVAKQKSQIETLPDAEFDNFTLAFLAYRKSLRKAAA
jgi:hypothetical protein